MAAEAKQDKDDKIGQRRASIAYQFGWTADGSYQGSAIKGHGKIGQRDRKSVV